MIPPPFNFVKHPSVKTFSDRSLSPSEMCFILPACWLRASWLRLYPGLLLAAAENSVYKDCGLATLYYVHATGLMRCWIAVHNNLKHSIWTRSFRLLAQNNKHSLHECWSFQGFSLIPVVPGKCVTAERHGINEMSCYLRMWIFLYTVLHYICNPYLRSLTA